MNSNRILKKDTSELADILQSETAEAVDKTNTTARAACLVEAAANGTADDSLLENLNDGSFSALLLYNPQGKLLASTGSADMDNLKTTSENTEYPFRNTILYKRLMAHLQYYTTLDISNGTPAVATAVKLFDDSGQIDVSTFTGILVTIYPLGNTQEKAQNLADQGDTVLIIGNNRRYIEISSDSCENTTLKEAPENNGLSSLMDGLNHDNVSDLNAPLAYTGENGRPELGWYQTTDEHMAVSVAN